MKKFSLLVAMFFCMTLMLWSNAIASTITWQAIQDATGNVSDVVTTGNYFDAATSYTSDLTINGVTFNHYTGISGGTTSYDNGSNISFGNVQVGQGQFGAGAPGTWDTDYQNLLRKGAYTLTSSGPITLNIGGLTPGSDYLVQLWMPYWNLNWRTEYKDEFNNSSGYLNNGVVDQDIISQFVVGTFTATATTEVITASGETDYAVPSALQVRDITLPPVPEPATMVLFGFGLLGIAGISRRKK